MIRKVRWCSLAARVLCPIPSPRLFALAFLLGCPWRRRVWIVTIIPPLLTGPVATKNCLVSVTLEAFEANRTLAIGIAVSYTALEVYCGVVISA